MVQAKNRVAITSQHLEELPERFKGGQYVLDNSKSNDGHRVFSNNVSILVTLNVYVDIENAIDAPVEHQVHH